MFEASKNFAKRMSEKQPSHGASAIPWALIIQALLPIVLNCFSAPRSLAEAKDSMDSVLGRAGCRRACRRAERELGRRFSRSEREEFLDQLRKSLDETDENEFNDVVQELQIE